MLCYVQYMPTNSRVRKEAGTTEHRWNTAVIPNVVPNTEERRVTRMSWNAGTLGTTGTTKKTQK